MQYINKNKKFVKAGALSILRLKVPASTNSLPYHTGLLVELISGSVTAGIPNLQPGEKFHIMETGTANKNLHLELLPYKDRLTLLSGAGSDAQMESCDIVISANVLSQPHMLSHLKTYLKQDGILILQESTVNEDTIFLLGEDGYEQMAVCLLENGGYIILAKSNGIIEIQETRSIPAPQSSNNSDAEWLILRLINIAAAIIELPEEEFDTSMQFKDFGFDSILGIELVNNINEALSITLKATDLYNYPNLTQLSDHIQNQYRDILLKSVAPVVLSNDPEKKETSFLTPTLNGIAIIGISGQFGSANNLAAYWDALKEGRSLIEVIPPDKWSDDLQHIDQQGTKWASCLKDIDCFDPLFFKLSGTEAEMMDPKQRLFLEHCWKAFEDAAINPHTLSSARCGVYVGVGQSDYAARTEGTLPSALWGNSSAILASRISYFLNLRGPAIAVDTACSSSLVAMDMAFTSLQRGDTDLAIAGGVNIINTANAYTMANRAGMLSADGRCYTFDSRANGFVMGEGVGVIVMKRLEDAERDNDHIYGVIKGSLTNQDGATNGITAPSVISQQELEKEVYERFKINPETITYVEAHGTGTSLGDPIEFEALTASFRAYTAKQQFCSLGSVKTNIGHTLEAAGVAGLLKILLAMQHQQLPPTINYRHNNPLIKLEGSPFKIQNELSDWVSLENVPRRAALSSFGFSGTNVHVVIEEYVPAKIAVYQSSEPVIFLLSAKNKDQLLAQARQFCQYLQTEPVSSIYDIAYTLQIGRAAMEERLAIVASTSDELLRLLNSFLENRKEGVFTGSVRNKQALLKNSADHTFIQLAAADKALDTLAQLWVNGKNIDWRILYSDPLPSKISLPAYPFAREHYWITSDNISTSTVSNFIHPLLHANCSTLSDQSFSSIYTGKEFFLRDHKVLGEQVLPGVTYLEMARAAGAYSLGRKITRLKDITWLQPIKVNGSALEVHIILFASGEEIGYEIYTESDERQVHGQGLLITEAQVQPARHDMEILGSGLSNRQQGDSYYEIFRSMGLDYGESFQGIQEISYNEETALSRIMLAHQPGFVLSPGLLDSALQTCLSLSLASGGQELMLPFSVREISIYQELPEEVWCYTRQHRSGQHSGSYDIELLNASGEVLVQFTELVLLPVGNNRVAAATTTTTSIGMHLYTPTWQISATGTANQNEPFPVLVLLAGGPALLADKLQENLECEVKTINTSQPETFFLAVQEELQKRWHQKPGLQVQVVFSHTDYPDYGFISGLLQTASHENPKIQGKVISVDRLTMNDVEHLSQLLSVEQNRGDQEVRYQSGVREVKGILPLSSAEKSGGIRIKEDGVYLITGGIGGLGQHFAGYIGKVRGTRILLAGRSELAQTQQESIDKQQNRSYYRCDVSEAAEVTALIGTILERYGRLDGIIHSAGVIRDSYILNKTGTEVQEVFGAKVQGAKNIDIATAGIGLDFMVYCSSLAGVFGNAAQADYASANAWLDNYAHYRETERQSGKRHGRTLSINWPLWESGGMQIGAEAERYMAHHYGLVPMPSAAGLGAFETLLNSEAVQGIVLYGYQDKLFALTGQPLPVTKPGAPTPVAIADEVLYTAAVAYLGSLLATSLKIPVAKLQPDVPFEQFGIDSTMIIGLTNRLEEVFGKVSRTLFFECQTLDELSIYFLTTHSARLLELTGTKPVSTMTTTVNTDNKIKEVKKIRFINNPSSLATHRYAVNKSPEVMKDIAIIGISGRYPGASNLTEFWDNLKAGKDSITEIPSTRWDMTDFYHEEKGKPGKSYSKWGGFMDDIDKFDPLFFNISPREAELMDPQERLFLQTAWETMEDGGYTRSRLQAMDQDENGLGAQVGVYVGVMYEEYQLFGPEETVKGNPVSLLGNPSGIANRVSYFLNLHGPSTAVDSMCSSSLTAIHLACKDLQSGEIEMAIAGGVNASIHPNKYLILSQGGFVSSTGRCESFGEGGDGYVPGEGVGAVLLKPLQQAIADGDRIYGVIKGTAVNHGGKTNGYTVPNPKAQTAVIKAAMKKAGVQAEEISYIEAHGTGTSLGDPIEVAGLSKAFGSSSKQFCSLGSVKSNIGHCESAAGISGLTKVLLQLQHRQLVPSLHSAVLNPNIDFENSPFRVQQELAAWESPDGKPRIAGISGFGAGGSNAHIIIEEYIGKPASVYQNTDPVILILSARDTDRLQEQVSNLKKHIETHPEINIHEVAYTLQTGREAMEERLAFTASDQEELLQHLGNYLEHKTQELLTGNIRKDGPGFLLEGKAGKAYLESAVREKESRSLAQLWTKGVYIDWNLLYTHERPALISLPTYAFAKERCWFRQSAAVSQLTASKLHPLLHSNTSNLKEQPLHPLLHTYNSESLLN